MTNNTLPLEILRNIKMYKFSLISDNCFVIPRAIERIFLKTKVRPSMAALLCCSFTLRYENAEGDIFVTVISSFRAEYDAFPSGGPS